MIRKEQPIDRIHKAQTLVARAANGWHAGSIVAVEESLAALEESAVQLRAVEAEVAEPVNSLTGRNLTGARNEILRMKDDIARMERLSNLAARFLGGGSPESCNDSPLYGAGGIAETNLSPGLRTIIQA